MSRHTTRVRAGDDRASLYTEITDKIIAELEAGRIPWVQPWGTAAIKAPLAMPRNAATQRGYSGINVLILWGAVIEHGFSGQSWLTFRQALGLGGHVRKGERGTTVVYADRPLNVPASVDWPDWLADRRIAEPVLFILHHLQEARDRRQRRAQLVRHGCDERIAHPVELAVGGNLAERPNAT